MRLLVATPLTLDRPEYFEDCREGEPVYWNTACTHSGSVRTIGAISLGCDCEWGFDLVMTSGTTDVAIVVDEPRMTGAHYLAIITGAMLRDTGDVDKAREVAFALMAHANRLGTGAIVCRWRGEFRRRRPYAYLPRLLEALDDASTPSCTR